MRALTLACLLLVGCAEPPAPPALTVGVWVDGEASGRLILPAGPGPWPLLSHLPSGLPDHETWRSVTVEGAGGQVFTIRNPSGREGEEARFYRRVEGMAFAMFLVPPAGASTSVRLRSQRPALAVPEPTRVLVRTAAPAPARSLPPE